MGGLKLSIGSIEPVTHKTAYSSRWPQNVNKNLLKNNKKAKGDFAAQIFTTKPVLRCFLHRWLHVKNVAYGNDISTGAFGKSPLILSWRSDINNRL